MNRANAMSFVPMLDVVFIGARMRALQMDPVNGAAQKWVQNSSYMCTYSVLAQVLISIAVILVLSGTAEKGEVEGEMVCKVENNMLGTILPVGRYVIMFCIYVGFTCVIYSTFTIQHPHGATAHARHLCRHAMRDYFNLPVFLHLPHDMDLRDH